MKSGFFKKYWSIFCIGSIFFPLPFVASILEKYLYLNLWASIQSKIYFFLFILVWIFLWNQSSVGHILKIYWRSSRKKISCWHEYFAPSNVYKIKSTSVNRGLRKSIKSQKFVSAKTSNFGSLSFLTETDFSIASTFLTILK